MLRSARLESVFGAQIAQLTSAHVEQLVTDAVPEAADLDFKLTLYGRSEADRRSLATDVAALANTTGGLLILGVEEDEQARAVAAPGVALSDDEDRRMRQVIASGVAPLPVVDVLPLATSTDSTHGFYVLAVQRTQAAPHGVVVNDGFRYPRRNGATTRYLSEPEVAEAYRARLAGLGAQTARVTDIWQAGVTALDADEEVWLAASLVPDVPGSFRIDRASSRAWDHSARQQLPTVVPMSMQTMRTFVGRGYLGADGRSGAGPSRWFRRELHHDGSGFYALACGWLRRGSQGEVLDQPDVAVDDEHLTLGVLSALVRLSEHARASAASGPAALRIGLYGLSERAPASLTHPRGGFRRDTYNDITLTRDPEPVDTTIDLDSTAGPGPDLIASAGHVSSRLAQSFGVAELGQFSDDGRIRRRYVSNELLQRLERWAGDAVELSDDVLEP